MNFNSEGAPLVTVPEDEWPWLLSTVRGEEGAGREIPSDAPVIIFMREPKAPEPLPPAPGVGAGEELLKRFPNNQLAAIRPLMSLVEEGRILKTGHISDVEAARWYDSNPRFHAQLPILSTVASSLNKDLRFSASAFAAALCWIANGDPDLLDKVCAFARSVRKRPTWDRTREPGMVLFEFFASLDSPKGAESRARLVWATVWCWNAYVTNSSPENMEPPDAGQYIEITPMRDLPTL
ncbi:hypothetical protein [Streptomyces sp. CS014]|uniref:hypothetical protein n=1 Tax=Streptomyces sp. CS014 TaxID=2162707 RepID=UPI000D523B55|nr:hypothetical protein [Streptomyces sp. CS014]PVD04494.1 hypothetical protein DBP12_03450 [Streptomyces sp. CS014]